MKRLVLGAMVAASLLAGFGCSGAGTGTAPTLPVTPASTSPQTASAKVSLRIPVASVTASGHKRPAYVSSGTQSVRFSINGAPLSTVQLAPLPNASCPLVGSYYQCSLSIAAPLGASTLAITTYASTDATGVPLSLNSLPIDIVIDQPNTVGIVLNGVVATLTLNLSQSSVYGGGATAITATWGAQDVAGYNIVGAGAFVDANNNPITPSLATSDTSAFSVGALSGNSFPVAFNGNASSGTTLTLSASGYSSATATVTVGASPSPQATNAIANGTFTSAAFDGTASWYRCYAPRVNAAGAVPINPSPAQVNVVSPTANTTPVPATLAAGDVTQQSAVPTNTAPPSGNAHFALVGYSSAAGVITGPYPTKARTGICQNISVPSAASLTFNIFEGGDDSFAKSDSEVDVYPGGTFTGTNPGLAGTTAVPTATLMSENNCYDSQNWEGTFLGSPWGTGSVAITTTARWAGCPQTPGGASPGGYSPSSGGGFWYSRTLDMSSYAGQSLTLFMGIGRDAGGAKPTASGAQYYNYAYFDNVALTGTTGATPPALSVAPNPFVVTEPGAMTLTATETGYGGSLTVTSDNPSVITVTSPATAAAGSATIHVNVVNAGFANLTIKDATNQAVVVPVTVTLTPVNLQ